jgi:hypothetical protein
MARKHFFGVNVFNNSGPTRGVVTPKDDGVEKVDSSNFITVRVSESNTGKAFSTGNKRADVGVLSTEFARLKMVGATLQMDYDTAGAEPFVVTNVRVAFPMGIDFHFGPIRGHWWLTATHELIPQLRFNFELVLFERGRICTTFESAALRQAEDVEELAVSAVSPSNGSSASNEKNGLAAPAPAPAS